MLALGAGCATKQAGPVPVASVVEQKLDVVEAARANIGVPYKYGGTSPNTGFDCSGLVCWSYEQVGINLPRRARDQLMFGIKVDSKRDLQPGDIVVFKGTRNRTGWHSGIYTGDGKFVHSPSTGKTVTESRLDETYFAQRYAGARRIPRDGTADAMYERRQEKERLAVVAAASSKSARKTSKKPVLVASAGNKGKAAAKMSSGKAVTQTSGKDARKKTETQAAKKSGGRNTARSKVEKS